MNSKLKIMLSVFALFALFLKPIYAIEETEMGFPDDLDTNNTTEVPETPDGPIIIGVIEIPIDPIDVERLPPSISVNQSKIITNKNDIRIEGRLEELGVNVKYEIPETGDHGNCLVNISADTIELASFSAVDIIGIGPIDDTDSETTDPHNRISFVCNIDISELEDEEYTVDIIAKNDSEITTTKDVKLVVDRTAPEVIIDSISTRDRTPILTGAVDDLTEVIAFKLAINGINYQPEIKDDGTWEIQLEELPRGTQNIEIYAKDEATNTTTRTEEDAITIRGGGGTRIVAEPQGPTETITPAPAPETPAAQPVVTQPTVVNVPTTPTTPATGRTPAQTAPTTGNIPVANPSSTSGSTGFLGLPTGASTSLAIIVGALLVVGALGYFLFFAKK